MTKYEPREHVIDAELANGNLEAWRQVLGFSRQTLPPPVRYEIKENGYRCFEVFDLDANDPWLATFCFFKDAREFVEARQRSK